MELKTYLKERQELVEGALEEYVPRGNGQAARLWESMRYSVFAGGKRLRPVLVMAGAEAVGGEAKQVLPAACALELIHTYSLVHDDLPAMDDDDMRRGKPTNHVVFGEATAILAGDALLTHAFSVLAQTRPPGSDAVPRVLQAVDEVADAAGPRGMVAGQQVDILSEGMEVETETMEFIHRHKTGALIRAAVRSGALLAGGNEAQLRSLTGFAEEFGLLFQITDDILNVVGDAGQLGKPVGSDVARQKATYPGFYGLEGAQARAREAEERALAHLDGLGPEAEPLRALTRYLREREA